MISCMNESNNSNWANGSLASYAVFTYGFLGPKVNCDSISPLNVSDNTLLLLIKLSVFHLSKLRKQIKACTLL